MDSTTLKSMVIEMKDQGMSFQDIANKLENDYGVTRTRQALGALYKRSKDSSKEIEKQKLVCNVVNLYCLSDSAVQVLDHLNALGIKSNYRQVLDIVKQNQKYIATVENTIIANLEASLDTIRCLADASNLIMYKGIIVSKKRLGEYFEQACYYHIRKSIKSNLSQIYSIVPDRSMINRISEKFGIIYYKDSLQN